MSISTAEARLIERDGACPRCLETGSLDWDADLYTPTFLCDVCGQSSTPDEVITPDS